jgi:uncharacterized protein
MFPDTPLRIDVADLTHSPGASKSLSIDANIPELEVGLGRVSDEGAVHLELLLESLVEGVLASGMVSGEYELECSRCLIVFQEPFEVHVSEVYAYPDQPEFEEGFVVDGDTIDLEPMVRDEVLLAVPSNPLHDDACKGLCSTCGEDLNTTNCGHTQEAVDIRWEPLQKLKEELER